MELIDPALLISVSPGETRIARVNNQRLTSIDIIRPETCSLVGQIYLGRVETLHQGLQAAFLDIGTGKSGFLAVDDMHRGKNRKNKPTIDQHVNEGDTVIVQVIRDVVEDKGVKLTARCSPAGEEMERAKEMLGESWLAEQKKVSGLKAPALLFSGPSPALKALQDYANSLSKGQGSSGAVITDDASLYSTLQNDIRNTFPQLESALTMHRESIPLFEVYEIEEQIEDALGEVVKLPSGGSIHIQQTRALISIDVDSGATEQGKRETTNSLVNREAAKEAAHQIRLRNLSGQIVIDFLPMKDKPNRDHVLKVLRKGFGADPLKFQIYGYTQLGLVEVTRQRQGQSLTEIVCINHQKLEKTAASYALEALRKGLVEATAEPVSKLTLAANSKIIKALRGKTAPALADTESQLGLSITLEVDHNLEYGEYQWSRR